MQIHGMSTLIKELLLSKTTYICVNSRNIAYLFKVIWDNPTHRKALRNEAKYVIMKASHSDVHNSFVNPYRHNMDKFVRFVNLMINDVTYLMDESLSEMAKIHEIQTEMEDPEFIAKPLQYRREREQTLRSLERHASGYTQLGNSTVSLLKAFTGETKEPFMVPEIVDRLAAMLDYNLEALVGPKCDELKVKNPEKYKFNPKQLLSDIIQVYLNLSDQDEFARGVAADGRSYRKELFEKAAAILRRRVLKSPTEVEKLLLFMKKVEEAKVMLEAEEDLGEIPEEFLGECFLFFVLFLFCFCFVFLAFASLWFATVSERKWFAHRVLFA